MAGAFVNRHLVDYYAGLLGERFPTAVQEMDKAMSRDSVAQVLRALVDEDISIRNLPRIFEVLTLPDAPIAADLDRRIVFSASAPGRSQFCRDRNCETPIIERGLFHVRSSMTRYISRKYTRGANTLVAYLLDRDLERRLARPGPLSGRDRAALLCAVQGEIGDLPPGSQTPVILTTSAVRLRLRREIAAAFPRVAVVSYLELSPDMNIEPIARIGAPELTEMLGGPNHP